MGAGGLDTVRSPAFTAGDAARYRAVGWWSDSTLSDAVRRNAGQSADRAAYVDHPGMSLTWREFDYAANALAEQLAGVGVARGDRLAVWHGDSAAIHVLFVAVERCGAVVVGIGARAGTREVAAILRSSQPKVLISDQQRSGVATQAAAGVAAEFAVSLLVLGHGAGALCLNTQAKPRALGVVCPPWSRRRLPDQFHLRDHGAAQVRRAHSEPLVLLSPEGGRPRATDVGRHILARHPHAVRLRNLDQPCDPIYLGAIAVILDRFTTSAACEAISRHKVTVLCCVSAQLTMLMADRACRDYDLSSLRVVFAGGEALPYRPAAEFEELTGAKILQFYGSNETGLLSGTTVDDSLQRRLRTGGKIVPEMSVRLFDGDQDVTETGRGQPACRGPATSLGYLGGTDHDKLFTRDGWMRMGDICEIDAYGYLSVTGRTSDFILRGGRNISATQVEDAVTTHPAIAVAAAVAMPDPVFGEKVCLYTELADFHAIDLPELVKHLLALGVSKELLPERLIVVDELPRSSGGKIAKGKLREDIRTRMEANHETLLTHGEVAWKCGRHRWCLRSELSYPTSRRSRWPSATWPPSGPPRIWPDTSPGSPTDKPTCWSTLGGCGGRNSLLQISAWWMLIRGWFAAVGTSLRRYTSIRNCTVSATTPG
jgi:acyl-CoA synthetase